MKKLTYYLLTILLFICLTDVYSQKKMNEKRAIKEKHIDFSKEYIWFEISGLIEIDGHIFKNDTCKCPIIYKADIRGIELIDTCTNRKYQYRKCNKEGCQIIHLIELEIEFPLIFPEYPNWRYFNNQIILDSLILDYNKI